jgi:hypothetical protein
MGVAAVYDIHGNLPALEAVLQDIRQEAVDQMVVGGDVLPGPMQRETLTWLLDLNVPVQFYLAWRRAVALHPPAFAVLDGDEHRSTSV